MNDDLLELNGLDQSLSVDTEPILEKIDEVVKESINRKDVYYALDFGKNLIQMAQLSGMGLAKLFYLLRENWEAFELGDEFEDVAYAYVGRTPETVRRYIRVWEMYEDKSIPEQFIEEIRQKNIKDQIVIATLPSQGFEPTEEEWEEVADAPDYSSVAKIVRNIKGREPRKNTLLIFISPTGELQAQQEDEIQYVGFLNLKEEGDVKDKAIERIIRATGILRK